MRHGKVRYAIAFAVPLILTLMTLRLTPRTLDIINLHHDDFLESASPNSRQGTQYSSNGEIHAQASFRWTRNITEFPEFMMRWPTADASDRPPNMTCDTSDPTIPHVFDFTNFPTTYDKGSVFEELRGNLSGFWDTGITAATPASAHPRARRKGTIVCSVKDYQYIAEFPHQMQHIVPCWSLWQRFPNATRIFLIQPKVLGSFIRSSPFSKGMARVLKASNIEIVARKEGPYLKTLAHQNLLMVYTIRGEGYCGAFEDNMGHFRSKALAAHGLDRYQNRFCDATPMHATRGIPLGEAHGRTNGDGDMKDGHAVNDKQLPPPRIGIFNRKSTRHLIGAHNISNRIRQEFDLPYTPPVFFFEGMSFKEQMESFSNVDILLTPHGASLAGIPFMTRCSAVIEIFPDLYGRTDFYGTLAAMAGVNHSFVYLGDGPVQDPNLLPAEVKIRARNEYLCAPENAIIQAIRIQIDRWHNCCGFGGGLG